jgi:hypothetical protein
MKYPILIASLFVLHGVHSSGSLSTQKPNVTLISSTASTTPGSSTQGVTESKANPVGNSPVTSPAPTTTTSPNLNVLNATTEITETRPQYPSLHGAPHVPRREAGGARLRLATPTHRISHLEGKRDARTFIADNGK